MSELGYLEGENCARGDCKGVIACHPVDNCSCHIHAPCSACMTDRSYCPDCDWSAEDEPTREERLNEFVGRASKETGQWLSWKRRELDRSKIDWRNEAHTHFSMTKEGCFPSGTSRADVEKAVRGTFGGRFEDFRESDCTFKYIAYTD